MSGNELDFDELDKAVNSLMGGVDKENVQTSKTLDINTTLAPDETPAYTNLGQAAESIGSEAIDKHEKTVSINDEAPAPAVAKTPMPKRGGRFMDVMRPSSDMRGNAASQPTPVARQAAPIAKPPRVDTTAGNLPISAEPAPAADKDDAKPDVPQAPATEPLTSPFLPDAKVEKRPLGEKSSENAGSEPKLEVKKIEPIPEKTAPAAEPDMPTEEESASDKEENFSKMDAMNEPAQDLSEVTEHVPAEYEDKLLAVERISTTETEDEVVKSEDKSEAPAVVSIAKQYQEKPSTGESSNGSIYDTAHYHKPLTQSNKKPAVWKWVVAIVLLIAIGAGLGAAAYFFGFV